jgi:hypothetical protein
LGDEEERAVELFWVVLLCFVILGGDGSTHVVVLVVIAAR